MDAFSKEVDKLLQEKRREQDDGETALPPPQAQRQGAKRGGSAPGTNSSHYPSRRGGDQIPGNRIAHIAGHQAAHSNFRGRGWRGPRGYAPPRPSYSKRARESEFSPPAAAPAVVWTGGAKSFDYGHGSANPVSRATPSTSSGIQTHQARSHPFDVSAASKLAEATATAQLLKVQCRHLLLPR